MNGCCGPITVPVVFGPPTQGGYLNFLRNVVGVPTAALPDDSYAITVSYALSLDIVSRWLCVAGIDIFTAAVYNLAADRLIQFAQDPTNEGITPPYFQNLRQQFGINQFRAGVVDASHDESTGASLTVPDWAKNLTLLDLASMNTPYGRTALSFMQQIGSLWGLT